MVGEVPGGADGIQPSATQARSSSDPLDVPESLYLGSELSRAGLGHPEAAVGVAGEVRPTAMYGQRSQATMPPWRAQGGEVSASLGGEQSAPFRKPFDVGAEHGSGDGARWVLGEFGRLPSHRAEQ